MGALATTPRMLFAGRFIEGVGMGLIMVAAPLAISLWFPAHNRALPTGLWASSVGIGNVATLILAPSLAAAYGWQAVWWAGAGFSALAFILFAILFRLPKKDEMYEAPAPAPAAGEKPPSLLKGMANRSFWMISISFGCYNLVVMALCTFLPMFLEIERHLPAGERGKGKSKRKKLATFLNYCSHWNSRLLFRPGRSFSVDREFHPARDSRLSRSKQRR